MTTTLEALRIPAPLRGFAAAGDAQVFDVTLAGDRVQAIVPSASQAQARGTLLSAPVEAHAHIDKNYTVQDVGAAQGNLFAAIERMEKHRAGWSAEHIAARMERAVQEAWQWGTRALRTHLDWPGPETPRSLVPPATAPRCGRYSQPTQPCQPHWAETSSITSNR